MLRLGRAFKVFLKMIFVTGNSKSEKDSIEDTTPGKGDISLEVNTNYISADWSATKVYFIHPELGYFVQGSRGVS